MTSKPRPATKLDILNKIKGKQIDTVEFGETDDHKSEEIHICFTDNTKISILIGTNAYNIASEYGFNWKEIETDFCVRFKEDNI